MLASRPEWLERLVERTIASISDFDGGAEFGCHLHHDAESGAWEVTLFAQPILASLIVPPPAAEHAPIGVDIAGLAAEFDEINRIGWQSGPAGADDDLGCHLSVEGRFDSHEVWLRITARQPARLADESPSATRRRSPRFAL